MFRTLLIRVGVLLLFLTNVRAENDSECLEEQTGVIKPVLWPRSESSSYKRVTSTPACFGSNSTVITRICFNSTWMPLREDLPLCAPTAHDFEPESAFCPDGYTKMIDDHGEMLFCYIVYQPTLWTLPCLDSGLTTTLIDLDADELAMLLKQERLLDVDNIWLPAERQKSFGPLVWRIPGRRWGSVVNFDDFEYATSLPITKNCLVFDVKKLKLKTDTCSRLYHSVCIFKEDIMIPGNCPNGYMSPRFSNHSLCYGIELSKQGSATWEDFQNNYCDAPMSLRNAKEIKYFTEIARYMDLPNQWCWAGFIHYENDSISWIQNNVDLTLNGELKGITKFGAISKSGRITTYQHYEKLSCMGCQTSAPKVDTTLYLKFNTDDETLHLTIYSPDSIWREEYEYSGLKCFTNANGFVQNVRISERPINTVNFRLHGFFKDNNESDSDESKINSDENLDDFVVEKVTYELEILSDRSGEYWCEGHLYNLTHIETQKVFVHPIAHNRHVFTLILGFLNYCQDVEKCCPDFTDTANNLKKYFDVRKVIVMDILDIREDGTIIVVFHIIAEMAEDGALDEGQKVLKLLIHLKEKAYEISDHNMTYYMVDIKSATHCLPDTTTEVSLLHWEYTKIGQIAAPEEFCLQDTGLPVRRQCAGDFIKGGYWLEVEGTCSSNYEATDKTTLLYNISKGKVSQYVTTHFLTSILQQILEDEIIPADIYYLAMSLQYIVSIADEHDSDVDVGDIYNIAEVVNKLMKIDNDYLRLAQTMNSTNMLLDSLDIILSIIANNETKLDTDGISLAVTPYFIIQVSDPYLNNISGLALVRLNHENETNFSSLKAQPLYSNTTMSDIYNTEGLQLATWVPQHMLNTLVPLQFDNGSNPKVIIGFFYNDAIFQDIENNSSEVNGGIISVTIPGYESELNLPVFLAFKNTDDSINKCGFWDYSQKYNQTAFGTWAKEGCFEMATDHNVDICGCFHLTHFAQLIVGNRDEDIDNLIINFYHQRVLNVITLVGCSLSLLGISGILITAIIFRTWRQKPSTKVLLQLSVAIALQSIMMIVLNTDLGLYDTTDKGSGIADNMIVSCIVLGAVLHYSVLAAFTWMLITAVLQFIRYVRVIGATRPQRFMCKSILFGWFAPCIPILVTLAIDYDAYVPPRVNFSGYVPICYPTGLALYFGVILPVVAILATNLTIFVLVMCSVMRGPDGKIRVKDPELSMSQLRLSIILFFLLGLSWIFGLFTIIEGQILFSYLFCLTATLQGFVLFVYFIICDPATRYLWLSLVREYSRYDSSREKESSG